MAKEQDLLYTQVVQISEEFLGPAGERFVRRQIETHLSIQPEKIKTEHLPKLVDWLKLMFTMITNDARVVDNFSNRLLQLSQNQPTKSASSSRR